MRSGRLIVRAVVAVVTALVLSCALMAVAIPETRGTRRASSVERWDARPFRDYRVVVQVSFTGRTCFQEIEVRDGAEYLAYDSCGSSWLATLSVSRLFELSQRLERPAECFPSSRNCVCHRLRVGSIHYDEELGFPTTITWRRELRANWQHPDYVVRLIETRDLPNCASPNRALNLSVVSLTALP
jgi:hypothetical protein